MDQEIIKKQERIKKMGDGASIHCAKERLKENSKTKGWINVKDKLPESGKPVLVCYKTKYKTVTLRAKYLERWQEEGFSEDGHLEEYCDKEDVFYLYEGWYELVENYDDISYFSIQRQILFWQELPEPPKFEEGNN